MKKVINFNYKYNSDYPDRIRLLEESGFDGVFIYSQYAPKEYIDRLSSSSLFIEALHLPYKKFSNGECVDSKHVNVLWTDGLDAKDYLSLLLKEVDFASTFNIRTLIMHTTGGDTPPPLSEYAVNNVRRILDKCEEKEITLCLENLRRMDYLHYLYSRLASPCFKFCFDSGHANAMTHNLLDFPWDYFGGLLHCVHLNDNNGLDDQHLVPFKGNIQWANVIKHLNKSNPSINLTLEVRCTNEEKQELQEIDFLHNCISSLIKLESMFEEYRNEH